MDLRTDSDEERLFFSLLFSLSSGLLKNTHGESACPNLVMESLQTECQKGLSVSGSEQEHGENTDCAYW